MIKPRLGGEMRSVGRILIFALVTSLGAYAQSQPDSPAPTASPSPATPGTDPARPGTSNPQGSPASDSTAAPASPASDSTPANNASPDIAKPNPAPASASVRPQAPPPTSVAMAAERIFFNEAQLVENMRHYTPMVETYVQN